MKTREIMDQKTKSSARGKPNNVNKSNLNLELPSLLDNSMNSARSKNSTKKKEEEKKINTD